MYISNIYIYKTLSKFGENKVQWWYMPRKRQRVQFTSLNICSVHPSPDTEYFCIGMSDNYTLTDIITDTYTDDITHIGVINIR